LEEGERIEIEIKGVSKIKELSDKYFGIVKLNLKREEMRRILSSTGYIFTIIYPSAGIIYPFSYGQGIIPVEE